MSQLTCVTDVRQSKQFRLIVTNQPTNGAFMIVCRSKDLVKIPISNSVLSAHSFSYFKLDTSAKVSEQLQTYFDEQAWKKITSTVFTSIYQWIVACKCMMFAIESSKEINYNIFNNEIVKPYKNTEYIPIHQIVDAEHKIEGVDIEKWKSCLYTVVLVGCYMKLFAKINNGTVTTDTFILEKLKKSNNTHIVYTDDETLGTTVPLEQLLNPVQKTEQLNGLNLLGKAWMEIRDKLSGS